MKNTILILIVSLFFVACTSKDVTTPKSTEQKTQIQSTKKIDKIKNDDEFFDDFANEFENEFAKEEKKEVYDPLSGYNRAMTSFNDFFFINVLNPVASGYAKVVPQDARIGISNFFDNLMFPIRFTNNLLQLKFKNATEELGRFVINSTIGVLGFMDPAKKHFGLEAHKEDFGQTLGFYGVPAGPHLVLPFLGPSNLRDTVGLSFNYYLDPTSSTASSSVSYKIPENLIQSVAITTFDTTNSTSLRLGQYENIKKDALDLYPFLRDVYEQQRQKAIEE